MQPSSSHSTHEDEQGLRGEEGVRGVEGGLLSSVLLHALRVWRVVRCVSKKQYGDAIASMLASSEFNIDNWSEHAVHEMFLVIQCV